MVSDSELVDRLRQILLTSDLNTTTAAAVRRQLQSDFGVDLSDRKKFISQQIDLILQGADDDNVNQQHQQQDDSGDLEDQEQQEVEEEEEEEEEDEQDEDEDDDDDEQVSDDKGSKNKRSQGEEMKKKRKNTGFTRLCSLSPQLQEFVGVSEMARTEVVKNLWAYIREKNLQDPNNRRNIKCDEKLHSIFRVDTINMFQMNKALSKHIWPLETEECSTDSRPLEKKLKCQEEEDAENSKRKAKQKKGSTQKKGGTSGFLAPLQLSDAFVKFLGTGETTLSRSDAVKRIWDYIKQNDLQDPSDKRRILCDQKLKELFDVDSFNGFSVTKLLTAHLTKTEQ